MDCHFRDLPDFQSSEHNTWSTAEAVVNRANPENDSP